MSTLSACCTDVLPPTRLTLSTAPPGMFIAAARVGVQDWTTPLAELRRILKPGGRLIVAVDHPFAVAIQEREAGHKRDYFATYNWSEE